MIYKFVQNKSKIKVFSLKRRTVTYVLQSADKFKMHKHGHVAEYLLYKMHKHRHVAKYLPYNMWLDIFLD